MVNCLRTALLASVTVSVLVGACDVFVPRTPLPDLLPGAVRILTDDRDPGAGLAGLCPASRAGDPVVGTLDGDRAASPFSTWLVAAGGRSVFVVWPRGFSARFEPALELIDSKNEVVARRGDLIDLSMNWNEGAGTAMSPYRPIWVNGGCYAPVH